MKKIVIFVGLLILLELILRIFYHPPEFEEKYRPSSIMWLHQNVVLNSQGYRDVEYAFEKPHNTVRIYVIGDSYTYGWFVNNVSDTYPEIIEEGLNQKLSESVEVINGSMWGHRIRDEYQRYIWEGKKYHPDILLFGINNFIPNVNNAWYRPVDIFLPNFIRTSRVYYYLVGNFLQKDADKKNHDFYLRMYTDKNSEEWKQFTEYILNLKDEASKSGTILALALYPHIHESNPNMPYDFKAFNDRFKEFGKQHGIPIADPLDDFIEYEDRSNLFISPIDVHPTAQMNRLLGEAFIEQIDIPGLLRKKGEDQYVNESKKVTRRNNELGDFVNILGIDSAGVKNFIYFEENQDFQELPVPNASSRRSFIFPDKIVTRRDRSPEIKFYTYPEENGKLVIPEKLYGYEVLGFGEFNAISLGTTVTYPVFPRRIVKADGNYVITYPKNKNYYLFRVNVQVNAPQIVIDKDNKVTDVVEAEKFQVVAKENTKSISVPYSGSILSLAEYRDNTNIIKQTAKNILAALESVTNKGLFSLTDSSGNLKPYAKTLVGSPLVEKYKTFVFIDGEFTKVTSAEIDDKNIKLQLAKDIKKGQSVTFYAFMSKRYKYPEILVTSEKLIQSSASEGE